MILIDLKGSYLSKIEAVKLHCERLKLDISRLNKMHRYVLIWEDKELSEISVWGFVRSHPSIVNKITLEEFLELDKSDIKELLVTLNHPKQSDKIVTFYECFGYDSTQVLWVDSKGSWYDFDFNEILTKGDDSNRAVLKRKTGRTVKVNIETGEIVNE